MPVAKEEVKIEWLKKSGMLCQEYDSGMEFALLSDDLRQATTLVYCKDFFQDALMGIHNNCVAGIYGFKYDPAKDVPICMTSTKMLIVSSRDSKFSEKIAGMIDFVNQIEAKLKLIRTVVHRVSNPPKKYTKCGAFATLGSAKWQLSPPMLSLYTLLIRVGCCHTAGKPYQETMDGVIAGKIKAYQLQDDNLLSNAQKGLKKILEHGYAKVFYSDPKRNYPLVSIGTMHGSFGIVGFANAYTKDYCKWWHRPMKNKDKDKDTEAKTTKKKAKA